MNGAFYNGEYVSVLLSFGALENGHGKERAYVICGCSITLRT